MGAKVDGGTYSTKHEGPLYLFPSDYFANLEVTQHSYRGPVGTVYN